MMKRILIFASGSGTNTQKIIEYFQSHSNAQVVLVLTNKKDAKVIDRCKKLEIKSLYFSNNDFYHSNTVFNIIKSVQPDLIVLAGFLWKFPEYLLKEFPNRVINLHPALLPKYGGKGMYGMNVHRAVIKNKEKETGITIHYINENYDEGAIIFQKSFLVSEYDTPKTIASKIHELEYEFFPKVIEELLFSENKE